MRDIHVGTERHAIPLLASKLSVPPPPEVPLARPRLTRLIDAGARGPVTLVAAPAGWGKTVLLGAWVRAQPDQPVAWYTVGADDGPRFWAYVGAALGRAGVAAPGGEADLEGLAAAVARHERPVTLLVDDLHLAAGEQVAEGLDFLVRHADHRLRLVAATRTEPQLGLHRWRLEGGLTEVGTHDLAFTREETAELLACHRVPASARRMDDLQARTEGWPAGLRFAARSLYAHPDPDRFIAGYGGEHPSVASYLVDEVLAGQPDEARDVLLRTSIAEPVSGELAGVLTGRDDAGRVLAELERTNGFVVPVKGRPGTYRYHRMFGELLRAELLRRSPDQLGELHRRAAAWHADRHMPPDALRHALAGRDWARATDLLAQHWPELIPYGAEPEQPPAPPIPPPPASALRADPALALAYAAAFLDARDRASGTAFMRLAQRHRERMPQGQRARYALVAAGLRLAEAQLYGDHAAVLPAARQLLDLAATAGAAARNAGPRPPVGAEPTPFGPAGEGAFRAADQASRAVAVAAVGVAEFETGELSAAARTLRAGLAEARAAGLTRAAAACAGRLAVVHAVRGELRDAGEAARAYPGGSLGDLANAQLALALVALHRDRLAEAGAHLDRAAAPAGGACSALVAVARSALLAARGDLPAAHRALAAARTRTETGSPTARNGDTARAQTETDTPAQTGNAARGQTGNAARVERWLVIAEAELHTARGDAAGARALLGPVVREAAAAVALARAHLRADDAAAAARALPPWDTDGATAPPAVRVEAGVLAALAARRAGEHGRAARDLEVALGLADAEGFRRVFTRGGTDLRDLLAAHLDAGTAHWPLVAELVATMPPAAGDPARSAETGERLTERELTVLRYLQSMLSTVEIAGELSLSVNTVKTHVRNIYRKLAAKRRREAVRRGRELRLI